MILEISTPLRVESKNAIGRRSTLRWSSRRTSMASAGSLDRSERQSRVSPPEPQVAPAKPDDLFLRINYVGDVANLYLGQRLLADNYYKGTPWEIGLKRFLPEASRQPLELKVLPLRKDAPIYLPKDAWPKFDFTMVVSGIESITASPEYEIRISEARDRR